MMNSLLKRSLFAAVIAVSAVFGASTAVASAATGPWNWTDNSSLVSIRTNRPVWAVSYANGAWFYTDGQDLTTSGHIWKSDGKTSKDITSEIRAAGLTRVDDIATNGTSVLLLKNMTSSVNTIEAVLFTDKVTNVTTALQSSLKSNEGISRISGGDKQWTIVTSRGRLLSWDGTTSATEILLPDQIVSAERADAEIAWAYTSMTNGMTHYAGKLHLLAEPLDGKIFVVQNTVQNGAAFYLYDGVAFMNVTNAFPATRNVTSIASNGKSVLLTLLESTTGETMVTFDGSVATTIPKTIAVASGFEPKITWTGASWMILDGKHIYRMNGTTLEGYGQTRDYFTSIASDGSGHVLLGGAVSTDSLTASPSTPLTAKLVSVTETNMTTQTSMASTNGTTFWTWIGPNMATLRRDQSTTYNVGTWNANGIKKIELFVNWASRQTCDYGTGAKGNQTCTVTLVGSQYNPETTISLIGKVTDANDKVTWTTFTTLGVKDAAYAVAINTSVDSTVSGVSTWTWFEPNIASLGMNGNAIFKAQAAANDGLNRIDIYANGKIIKFCDFARAYGTQECSVAFNGSDFPLGTNVPVYAKATGAYGATALSTTRTVAYRDNLQNAGLYPATLLVGMSPKVDIVPKDQEVTFSAQAQDIDGIDHIDILVDGKAVQTCSFTNAYSPRECTTPISRVRYPNRDSIGITARVVDTKGFITLSDTRSFAIAK